MDHQNIVNTIIGALGFCVAWWVNTIWADVKAQKKEVADLQMKLVEGYVPRAEMEKTLNRLFDLMDEIRKEVTHISRNQTSVAAMKEILEKVKP